MKRYILAALALGAAATACSDDRPHATGPAAAGAPRAAAEAQSPGATRTTQGVAPHVVRFLGVTLPRGIGTAYIQNCPTGERALGGGFELRGAPTSTYTEVITLGSRPQTPTGSDVPTGWYVRLYNNSAASVTVDFSMVCAS